MATHLIEKGLDVPISGEAVQVIREARTAQRVAVVAADFPGMKPAMRVAEGDSVKRGQILFEDRKSPGVLHSAPGAGRVIGVNRGAKRALQSIVIDLSDGEQNGNPAPDEFENFPSYTGGEVGTLAREQIVSLLVESGQWTALRARPYGKVPPPESQPPHSIFVTAIDTNPLAPLPDVIVGRRREDFDRGLAVVSKLTEGKTHLCLDPHSDIHEHITSAVELQFFQGPHPAGNVGLHIHLVDPVGRSKVVWHLGYQDVIAIGHLFATGRLDVERVVSIAGPAAAEPTLVPTRLGASVDDVLGESLDASVRPVAGSILSGRTAIGEVHGYLGRYHNQITLLREGRERVFLGWLTPGWNAFSSAPIYLSRLLRGKKFPFTTTTNGSPRAMVPIGMYERIMPMDILPTFLLRALVVGDIEQAEKLGALELDEEDLALCTFVCPGKGEYGHLLRMNLDMIEKEG